MVHILNSVNLPKWIYNIYSILIENDHIYSILINIMTSQN